MRLIDAEALKTRKSINSANFNTIETIQEWIDNAPTIDLVTCGECKHRTYCYSEVHITNKRQTIDTHKDISYCSYGERKADEIDRR